MAIETDITKLVFNKLSNEKYEELKANGELVNNEFYITPDSKEDFDGEVPTKVSELENDLGFITADDVDLSSKADKETTYTKEEVDNLIQNIDIPEQTPNIKGGEYIDVIGPKGETLYEYERYMEPTGLDMGWTPYYTKTTDIEYITLPTSPELEDLVTNVANELYAFKLKKEDESKLVPVFNSNNIQLVAYDLLTDELCENLLPVLGIESTEITDEIRELSFTTVFTDVDKNSPVYATYLYNNETIMGTGNTADGIVLFVKNTHDEYGMVVHTMGKTEPFNTIELETSDKSLTIDFNEKALEMIENAGSDITTNGWNIFDHKFSDHLLNDPSWVRSDTFSWQDGGIYFTAYEELEKEFNNAYLGEEKEQEVHYYAFQETNGQHADIYFKSPTPSEGDTMYVFVPPIVEYNHLIVKSYDAETQTVAVYRNGDEEQTLSYFVRATNESYDEIITETVVETKEPLTDTYDDITITYYKSVNGLKICLQDQSDAIEQLYANTGVAWYYIIDTENKKFKLPRSKWNFVGSRGNVGDYVDESLPNIKGNVKNVRWQDTTDEMEGAFSDSTKDSINLQNYYQGTKNSDAGLLDFNASNSSSTYQDNAPVQQRATEMYLYFFMGDTLRDARIIDVNAVVEKANIIEETLDNKANIDLSNIPFLLPKLTLLYDGNISKGDTITFNDDPLSFDMIVGITDNTVFTGNAFAERMKLCTYWAGVDEENQSGYSQLYAIDFGDRNDKTYNVWFCGWTATDIVSFSQFTRNIKIYGVKIF